MWDRLRQSISPSNTFWFLSLWQIVARLRAGFRSHKTLPKEYRVQQLKNLQRMVEENMDRLSQALWDDLHKVRPWQITVIIRILCKLKK